MKYEYSEAATVSAPVLVTLVPPMAHVIPVIFQVPGSAVTTIHRS